MQVFFRLSLIAVFAFFFSCGNASTTPTSKITKPETQEQTEIATAELSKPTITETKEETLPNIPPAKEEQVQAQKAEVKPKVVATETKVKKQEIIKEAPEKAAPIVAEVEEKKEEVVIEKPVAFSHQIWDEVLRKYVSSTGKVNYKGLKADRQKLDTYVESLAQTGIQSSWSRKEKMAYLINAYNAYTVKLIIDNYPVSSITKLHGGSPWKVKLVTLGGKKYSLDQIENEILRPQYKDARIHFAVNCAAKSCPPLLNKAWTADNLNRYFEQQAKKFVNNTKFNIISADEVQISKIFEWYAVDFNNIIDYLNKYSNTKINPGAKVTYKEYDWALNQ